jgi:hypothetical protein
MKDEEKAASWPSFHFQMFRLKDARRKGEKMYYNVERLDLLKRIKNAKSFEELDKIHSEIIRLFIDEPFAEAMKGKLSVEDEKDAHVCCVSCSDALKTKYRSLKRKQEVRIFELICDNGDHEFILMPCKKAFDEFKKAYSNCMLGTPWDREDIELAGKIIDINDPQLSMAKEHFTLEIGGEY